MVSPFDFDLDQRVVINRIIRNDGTYPGVERGEILVHPGQTGTVIERGFFLQDIVVYSIRLDVGMTVGCMAKELTALDVADDELAGCDDCGV